MSTPINQKGETPRPTLSVERVRALFAKQQAVMDGLRAAEKRPAVESEVAPPAKTARIEDRTKRLFRSVPPVVEKGQTADSAGEGREKTGAPVAPVTGEAATPITGEPDASVADDNGPEDAGTAESVSVYFKSAGKIKIPLPTPSHPHCSKVRPGIRHVPHPDFSLPRKAIKDMGFVYPAIYGATMVEREIAGDISADDLMDLSQQMGGAMLKYSNLAGIKYRSQIASLDNELGRARAGGERQKGNEELVVKLRSELEQVVREKDEALRANGELQRQLDEGKTECESIRLELEGKARKIGELEEKLAESGRAAEQLRQLVSSADELAKLSEQRRGALEATYDDDLIAALKVSLGVLKRKAQHLFPEAVVDWDDLIDLKEADFETYRAPQ